MMHPPKPTAHLGQKDRWGGKTPRDKQPVPQDGGLGGVGGMPRLKATEETQS